MSRKQRFVLVALMLVNMTVLGVLVIMALQSWESLSTVITLMPTPAALFRSIARPRPTQTPTLSPTPQPTPTPTPTSTSTQTPTPSPTPTMSPTPTYPPHLPTPTPCFAPTLAPGRKRATLDEFWEGDAEWVIEAYDVGLPVGESDTVYRGGGEFWSYLHADYRSAWVVDSCGDQVPYPGCVTLWKSYDGGLNFEIDRPVCLFPCVECPCSQVDHVEQQQYPRVFFDVDQAYMVYEWGGATYMRTSADGVHWSGEMGVPGTGVWYTTQRECSEAELILEHPHVYSGLEYDCLAGAPPGIYIEGSQLYVFVGLGRAPGHMGCLVGNKYAGPTGLRPCESNPLFGAEAGYGPPDVLGARANEYFEFRTISSADVVRVGDHYYMAYEGTRGPSAPANRDDQFALGFSRSISPTIDGPWEKYAGNPVIADQGDYWGIGHADLVIVGQTTYLYTSTSPSTRGRYVLVRK